MTDYDLSSSLEDYLEAIYHIVEQKQAARAKDIADRMAVNSSSVTGALQSLATKGLVNYAPYDIITLTDDGKRVARDVIRRHEALHHFLVKVLSVESKEAEEAACKMEHDISPKILERLIQFVDFIDNCLIGGTNWSESQGFICKHKEVFGDCEKCKEEFDKQWKTKDDE
jgi:DtxR family Mn-dependent transcriptional regulator